ALEMSLLMASFAQQSGLDARVVYGYLIWPEFSGFDNNLPHVWVEYQDISGMVVMDPFLEALVGFDSFDVPPSNRLTFGVWNPQNQQDSVLGLLSSSPRLIPQLAEPLPQQNSANSYELAINAPFEL